ncbi:uncharacterized protein LOC107037344 [Diachasma alloeum]|uniref:uncharacterized protein LOC107037344 n=1 Tax=Diachasma alloeum TaxID=454923 RepID=UPI0007383C71|nr:uncharacterized protein LOC107037344 [Diachasma alloeum]
MLERYGPVILDLKRLEFTHLMEGGIGLFCGCPMGCYTVVCDVTVDGFRRPRHGFNYQLVLQIVAEGMYSVVKAFTLEIHQKGATLERISKGMRRSLGIFV